jgi:hypothetical protein
MWIFAQSATFGEIGAVITSVVVFMIPIVAILTRHQHKMAELIHGRREAGEGISDTRLAALESQVAELAVLVKDQTLALENLRPSSGTSAAPPEISARMSVQD